MTVTYECGTVTDGPLTVTKANGGFFYEFIGTGAAAGWTAEVGAWTQADGSYSDVSSTTTQPMYESASYAQSFGDFTYEVAMVLGRTVEPGQSNTVWVRGTPQPYAYAYKRWSTAIAFNITANGKYSIYRFTPTKNTAVQGWTVPSGTTIVANGVTANILKVQGTGGTLKFWINGVEVKTITGQPLLTGKVGLGMARVAATSDFVKVPWTKLTTANAAQ